MMVPLPESVQTVLNQGISIDNLHLAYNKYIWVWEDPGENYSNWNLKNGRTSFLKSMTGVRDRGKAFSPEKAALHLKQLHVRQAGMMKGFKNQEWKVCSVPLYTASRLIAGLGYKGALETGITLHHLYGFPFLPASSIKGIARAAAELLLSGASGNAEDMLRVFGGETEGEDDEKKQMVRGGVRFLDALPMQFPKLELDILTPHYQPYYDDPVGNPPGNWFDPVPVPFLTVAPDTAFQFVLMSRDSELLDKAQQWMQYGLTELGAGGKTSSGYGYFTAEIPKQSSEIEKPSGQESAKAAPASPSKVQVKAAGAEWIEMPPKKQREVKAFAEVTHLEPGGKNKVKLLIHGFDNKSYDLTGYRNLTVGDQVSVLVERKKDGSVVLVRWQRPK